MTHQLRLSSRYCLSIAPLLGRKCWGGDKSGLGHVDSVIYQSDTCIT